MKKMAVIVSVIVVGMLGALPAQAQWEDNPANFVLLSQTQLGNLGYTRYRGFGARALGMGGAYIALADDLTAASWNPAGLAQILSPSISAGVAYSSLDVDQRMAFQGDWTAGSSYSQTMPGDRPISFSGTDSELHLDYLAGSYPFFLSDDWALAVSGTYFRSLVFDQSFSSVQNFADPLRIGFHRLNPGCEDPFDPSCFSQNGAFDIDEATASQNRDGYLDAYSGSVAASYRDRVYVGLTLSYWDGSMTGTDEYVQSGKFIPDVNSPKPQQVTASSTQDLGLSMSGWGVAIGGLVKLPHGFRVGVVYKPGFTLSVDGDITRLVKIEKQNTSPVEDNRTFSFDGSEVDYPDSLGIGLAWNPKVRWTVALDWNHTAWKGTTLKGTEETLEGQVSAEFTFPSLSLVNSSLGRSTGYGQFDSTVWRMGVEYIATVKGIDVPLRLGAFKESAYRNAPGVGDGLDVTGFSAGLGVAWRHWKLDVAAVYESSDQGLQGAQFEEPRIAQAGPEPSTGTYEFLPGSNLSQSSFRLLVNLAYRF